MLTLSGNAAVPLYKQLYDQIRAEILSGKLSAGARLPSVRDLMVELSVSRNTVEGAFQELHAEGYIFSKPRSGYFVSELHQEAAPRSLPGRSGVRRDPPPEVPPAFRYDFHPARLDPESFPLELWRKCLVTALRESPRDLVQYGNPQGERELRVSIQRYLERSRGVLCDPEQIVICAGLQQSLEIVAHLLQGSHSVVAVEDPGYFLPRAVFRNHGFEVRSVPVGAGGLDLDLLKTGGSTVVYVTPSHQLPTGCVMPVANRLTLIDWAQSGGRFIIEDDYDSELRYYGKPIPSLQGLRPSGNIVYAGTFSKILSPALRISYLVLPAALLPRYRELFGSYFPAVSLLEQRTLNRFMELGHWERHVRRMRMIYRNKHDALLDALERHFGPRALVVGQGAGLHVVAQLTGAAPGESEVVAWARRHGIRLFPFSDFCAGIRPELTTLVLGFGGMTAGEIEDGVALLSGITI